MEEHLPSNIKPWNTLYKPCVSKKKRNNHTFSVGLTWIVLSPCEGVSGVPECQQEMSYCFMDFAFQKGCEACVSLHVTSLRFWQVVHFICPAEPSSCVVHARWLTVSCSVLSLFNEVPTLMMFLLVVLILLTWHVTLHCSSLPQQNGKFTPSVDEVCMIYFLLIKQKSWGNSMTCLSVWSPEIIFPWVCVCLNVFIC